MSIWSRIYERIHWKDEPIEETPLSARNLNKMDAALYEIDGRVVELSGYESVVIDYSNQAKNSAANALSSETKAKTSEQNSYAYEQSALTSKNQAEVFKNEAKTNANNASASERNAKLSEDNASASELLAKNSEENASDFATSASRSSENASGFAESAKTSAQNAKNSEDIAVASASSAKTDSDLAKSYTVGTHGEVRENDDTDNAKYYYEQTKSFVSGSVTGVKGEAEEEFREGNVIITKENLGLENVPNVSTNDQQPTYSEATTLETLKSGEKLSVAFGKIAKAIKEFIGYKSHVGMIIQSTTLDTEAKVKAIYGGKSWTRIEGRMLIGASSSYAVNSTGGSATHTISTAEMPSHSHTQQGTFNSGTQSANHTHSIPTLSGTANNNYITFGIATEWKGDSSGSSAINDSATWANTAGDVNRGLSQSTHTHTVTTNASTTGSNSANHTHSVTISGSTTSSGSGKAMNIMNPYKAVYIWERTA